MLVSYCKSVAVVDRALWVNQLLQDGDLRKKFHGKRARGNLNRPAALLPLFTSECPEYGVPAVTCKTSSSSEPLETAKDHCRRWQLG